MKSGLEKELKEFSELIKIEGTGEIFKTPIFYKFLVKYIRIIGRSLSRVNYTGIEKIPKKGPVIIIGNHISNIDPIVKIMGAKRPVHYLAKAEHFEDKKFQKLMTSTGQIETFRESGGVEALASAVDVLLSGNVMGIFPEGTRSRSDKPPYLSRGKTGVARLAARFPEVPVVPMAIIGARKFMAPGSAIVNPLAKVQVNIDNPITFGNWLADEDGGNMSDEDISNIAKLDEDGQRSVMKSHYRRFTDQLIENLRILGAP